MLACVHLDLAGGLLTADPAPLTVIEVPTVPDVAESPLIDGGVMGSGATTCESKLPLRVPSILRLPEKVVALFPAVRLTPTQR